MSLQVGIDDGPVGRRFLDAEGSLHAAFERALDALITQLARRPSP